MSTWRRSEFRDGHGVPGRTNIHDRRYFLRSQPNPDAINNTNTKRNPDLNPKPNPNPVLLTLGRIDTRLPCMYIPGCESSTYWSWAVLWKKKKNYISHTAVCNVNIPTVTMNLNLTLLLTPILTVIDNNSIRY